MLASSLAGLFLSVFLFKVGGWRPTVEYTLVSMRAHNTVAPLLPLLAVFLVSTGNGVPTSQRCP